MFRCGPQAQQNRSAASASLDLSLTSPMLLRAWASTVARALEYLADGDLDVLNVALLELELEIENAMRAPGERS